MAKRARPRRWFSPMRRHAAERTGRRLCRRDGARAVQRAAAGVSFDGRGFFYVNPLEVYPRDIEADADYQSVKPVRQPWFACACCPPNLVRLLTGLGAYLYTHSSRTLYVHLFADSAASVRLSDALCVQIRQTTDYPWDGAIHFEIQSTGAFRLAIRIPGWCENASLLQDHAPIALSGRMNRGYALLDCPPGKTDVELSLDMPPCFVEANPAVKADAGKVAVMRGPVVYCAEECDNGPRLVPTGRPSGRRDRDLPSAPSRRAYVGNCRRLARGRRCLSGAVPPLCPLWTANTHPVNPLRHVGQPAALEPEPGGNDSLAPARDCRR